MVDMPAQVQPRFFPCQSVQECLAALVTAISLMVSNSERRRMGDQDGTLGTGLQRLICLLLGVAFAPRRVLLKGDLSSDPEKCHTAKGRPVPVEIA